MAIIIALLSIMTIIMGGIDIVLIIASGQNRDWAKYDREQTAFLQSLETKKRKKEQHI